jgi:hypothetical protein
MRGLAFWLSFATVLALEGLAVAQTRFPRAETNVAMVRTYLGCSIDSGRYLSLRNTTSATIALGTPVYWTGKQEGQAQPHDYSAPLYAAVAPGGVYQIGGVYRYDPSVTCRVWVMRRAAATRAP